MKTAHQIRMNPTLEQVEYLKRACGAKRFIYNWGREQWEQQYQAYKAEQETLPEAERQQRARPQKTVSCHSRRSLSLDI